MFELDRFTIRNLELFRPNSVEGKCLIDVIDRNIISDGRKTSQKMGSITIM